LRGNLLWNLFRWAGVGTIRRPDEFFDYTGIPVLQIFDPTLLDLDLVLFLKEQRKVFNKG
jgi:hypothetical protein